jgi:hypothetical protein
VSGAKILDVSVDVEGKLGATSTLEMAWRVLFFSSHFTSSLSEVLDIYALHFGDLFIAERFEYSLRASEGQLDPDPVTRTLNRARGL